MNWSALAQALGAITTAAATLVGVGARKHRLRTTIKANTDMLVELRDKGIAAEYPMIQEWVSGRIALDVAKVCGIKLGNAKKPIPWSSVVVGAVVTAGFAFWSYVLSNWWSIPTAVVAGLMFASTLGMFMNREIPTEPQSAGTAQENASTEEN